MMLSFAHVGRVEIVDFMFPMSLSPWKLYKEVYIFVLQQKQPWIDEKGHNDVKHAEIIDSMWKLREAITSVVFILSTSIMRGILFFNFVSCESLT